MVLKRCGSLIEVYLFPSNMGMSLRGMTQYNKSFIEENTEKETGKIIYG